MEPKMIQQGGWIHASRGMRPDQFFKHVGEQIAKTVPEEFEKSLHMWLEVDQDWGPAIRLQWERPMSQTEIDNLYGKSTTK